MGTNVILKYMNATMLPEHVQQEFSYMSEHGHNVGPIFVQVRHSRIQFVAKFPFNLFAKLFFSDHTDKS